MGAIYIYSLYSLLRNIRPPAQAHIIVQYFNILAE